MQICQTARLNIRHFQAKDAEFIVNLLNQPSFIDNIGDKQVRNQQNALNYLKQGPMDSYKKLGFGLNLVTLKDNNQPIGMCGLLKRAELEHVDLGYALLPEYAGQGYAQEAALAVMQDGHVNHQLNTLTAITTQNNLNSNKLLTRLGFELIRTIEFSGKLNNLYRYRF